jgi:hypothetical protein
MGVGIAQSQVEARLRAHVRAIEKARSSPSVHTTRSLQAPSNLSLKVWSRYQRLSRNLNELWESFFLLQAGAPSLHAEIVARRLSVQIAPFMQSTSTKPLTRDGALGALSRWRLRIGKDVLVGAVAYLEGFIDELAPLTITAQLRESLASAAPLTPLSSLASALAAHPNGHAMITREIDRVLRYATATKTVLQTDLIAPGMKAHFLGMMHATVDDYSEANARRNIIIHNDARVNSYYLALVPASHLRVGARVVCDEQYLSTALTGLRRVAVCITKGVVSAFGQTQGQASNDAEKAYQSQHGTTLWP